MWLTWVLLTVWTILFIGGLTLGFLIGDDLFDKFVGAGAASLFVGVFGFIFLGWPALAWAQTHYNEHVATCTVESKDRTSESMRVYTKECGVFINEDSLFRGKTDSADVWNKIKVGETQKFRVVGWRFSLTSDFPNVLDVQPAG